MTGPVMPAHCCATVFSPNFEPGTNYVYNGLTVPKTIQFFSSDIWRCCQKGNFSGADASVPHLLCGIVLLPSVISLPLSPLTDQNIGARVGAPLAKIDAVMVKFF
jgi:hypothetical protein